MKCESDVKKLFIANAIHLIAEGGFEKATTKELAFCGGTVPGVKMNEVYIYRLFGSKEQLYEEAFIHLDKELFTAVQDGIDAMGGFESDTKARLYQFFLKAWPFLLHNEERCRCYVRYYYSIYFKGNSLETHRRQFREVIVKIEPLFKEEADVHSILHSVFTTILDFAIRVYNGDLEDSEENQTHIFNVLYCMMMTYFKEPVKVS